MVFEISAESEQQRRAGHLREAAQADAALHAVLRRDYRGRHDVLDALWWRAHPLTESPSGRPDPAAALPDLQAAVYSRARSAESAPEDEERLAALKQALDQDTADLEALLEQHATPEAAALAKTAQLLSARAEKGPLSAPDRGTFSALAGTVAGDATEIEVDAGPEAVAGPENAARRRLRGLRAGALVLAGTAIGVLSLLALQASGLAGATDAPGAATSTAGVSETAGPTASANDLLAIFDGPEFVPDETAPALGGEYTAVHSLFGPTPEYWMPYSVFAARLRDDQYCLILRTADLTGTSVCTTLDELTQSGLHLNATVMGTLAPPGPLSATDAYDQLTDVTVDWTVAGGMTSTSGPHRGAEG
ncbi:hypothetical protein E3O44_14410 [Cryobacterium algoricola]|uniref:Anti-sigma factor n=1 Tax=Cryobacterium algoricola TaxID=1259183 RepID=A0ABY2ICR8_9MICO|nr:hypothetical protein [Cryobacterium algoricola]TFB85366.1 hypothetical protein E3O44_14410 [Cryobacterium algoricola]